MDYSYTNPVGYGSYNGLVSQEDISSLNQSSYTLPVIGGAVAGSSLGGYLGYKGQPYMSGDIPKDTFTKNAYLKYIDKIGGAEKDIYTQGKEILKEIDKLKTADELKTLLQSKQEAAKEALGHSYDDIITNLTDANLAQNKRTIKNSLYAQEKNNMQKMKNWIQSAWNSNSKKLEKPAAMSDDLFGAIKKSAGNYKFANLGKGLLIGGVLSGIAGFVATKILEARAQQ